MLITTTPGIEGRPVTGYLGIVTAQGVLGVNAFKDVLPTRKCPRLAARRSQSGVELVRRQCYWPESAKGGIAGSSSVLFAGVYGGQERSG